MAAPAGNRFWERRTKIGREKLFTKPEFLWEAACEYFAWAEDNPLIEIDYRGKDSEKVELPRMRPFTLTAMWLYFECSESWWRNFKISLRSEILDKPEKKAENEAFLTVIDKIEQTIYSQKFEGAAAGFLNANIISRDLGLKDNVVKDVTMKKKTTLTLKLNGGDTGNNIHPAGADKPLP